ncbi:uncharacterized protein LOC130049149 isoform X3 [Ostrea edulis]|nr:uncharacterized protein LOC130049149 isoform X3 [Ostrea edulis]
MVGEEFKIVIIGPTKSGKTSFINKLVQFPLYKPGLLCATTSVIKTHCWKEDGIEIVNNNKRTSHKKLFTSRKALQDFMDSHSDEIHLSFSVDVYIKTERRQMGCVFIEIPENLIKTEWEPGFSTDVLIVFASITDSLITQPETMKCTLSVYHEKLVFDTTKTYFVTNKWDTLNGDEDNVLHEEDNIKPLFESSVKNVWPVPIKKDHFFCISLRRTSRFSKGLDMLIEDVENTATKYFHFTADDAIEKTISLTQQLLKLLQMEEFPGRLKDELSNSSPKLLENLKTKGEELKTIEWFIVVAGDTSAGKTTLINRLVGHHILVPRTLASTAAVCRIRKSEKMQINLYNKENELLERKGFKDVSSLHDALRNYTELDKKKKVNDRNIHFVDINLPSETLQNRTVLVDTPGIGHDHILDDVLLDYLPNASSFIFLVDAANAGGTHEDRLMKIMRVVVEKQEKMPYFNLKDVLFLTNKWDSVESDSDSSEDEAEGEGENNQKTRMYDFIIGSLSREWPAVSKDTVFQVCLKKDESEYKSEFKRFQRKFIEVLEKNKSVRMCDDFRFVWEAFTNIERVVCARLDMQRKGEKQPERRNVSPEFQTKFSEMKEQLQLEIKWVTSTFATRCHNYLQSERGKEEILLKVPSRSVTTIHALKSEIASLLMNAVQLWLTGDQMRTLISGINKKIRSYVHDLEKELLKMQHEIFDVNTPYFTGLNDHNANISAVYRALLPCTISMDLTDRVILLLGDSVMEGLKENIYGFLLDKLDTDAIEKCLEMSIQRKYDSIIERIHDAYLRKGKSIQETMENINLEGSTMLHSCKELAKKLGDIRRSYRPLLMNMARWDRL